MPGCSLFSFFLFTCVLVVKMADEKKEEKLSWEARVLQEMQRPLPPNSERKKFERRHRTGQGLSRAEQGGSLLAMPEASIPQHGPRRQLRPSRIGGQVAPGYFTMPISGRKSFAAFDVESKDQYVLGVTKFIVGIPATFDLVELVECMRATLRDLSIKNTWTPDTRIQLTLEGHYLNEEGEPAGIEAFKGSSLSEASARWENFRLHDALQRYVLRCNNLNEERYKPVWLHRMRIIAIKPPVGGCGKGNEKLSAEFNKIVCRGTTPPGDLACGWRSIALGLWWLEHERLDAKERAEQWEAITRKSKNPPQVYIQLFEAFMSRFKLDLKEAVPKTYYKAYKRVCTQEDMIALAATITSEIGDSRTEIRIRVFDGTSTSRPRPVVFLTPSAHKSVADWERLCSTLTIEEQRAIVEKVKSAIFVLTGREANYEALHTFLDYFEAGVTSKYINLVRTKATETTAGVEFHYDMLKPNAVGAYAFNVDHFCEKCRQTYTKDKHHCPWICRACCDSGCTGVFETELRTQCLDCRRTFYGEACFNNHKREADDGSTVCDRQFQCKPLDDEDAKLFCDKCPVRHYHMVHNDARWYGLNEGGTMRPWWDIPQDTNVRDYLMAQGYSEGVVATALEKRYTEKEQKEFRSHVHNTFRCDKCKKSKKDDINQVFGHTHNIVAEHGKKNKQFPLDSLLFMDAETEKDSKGRERVNYFCIGKVLVKEDKSTEIVLASGEPKMYDSLLWLLQTRPDEIYNRNMAMFVEYQAACSSKKQLSFSKFIAENELTSLRETICIAHNGSKFDVHLILEELLLNPELLAGYELETPIRNGTRIVRMQLVPADRKRQEKDRSKKGVYDSKRHEEPKRGTITFLDSIMHVAGSLESFAKAMKIKDPEKHYFPHSMRNKQGPDGMDYDGPVPPISAFEPLKLSDKGAVESLKAWHTDQVEKKRHWNLRKINQEYCFQDVKLLGEAWLKYRQEILDQVQIDPTLSPTVPSLAKKMLLRKFLPADRELPVHVGALGKWMRKFLRGGRTEIFMMKATIENANEDYHIARSDARSLYPAQMINKLYPCAVGTHFIGKELAALSLETIVEWISNKKQIVFAQIDGHYTRFVHIPPLASKPDDGPNKDKLVFSLWPVKNECYTSVELRDALNVGFVIDKVHELHLWKPEECARDLFTAYMTQFYNVKFTEGGLAAVLLDFVTLHFNKNPKFWTQNAERKRLLAETFPLLKNWSKDDKKDCRVDWETIPEFCSKYRDKMQPLFLLVTGIPDLEKAIDYILKETVTANKDSSGIELDIKGLKMKPNAAKVNTAKLMINSLWGQLGQDLSRRCVARFLTEKDEAVLWAAINDKTIDVSVEPLTPQHLELIVRKKEGDIDQSQDGHEVLRPSEYARLLEQNEETEKVSTCTAVMVTSYGRSSLYEQMSILGEAMIMSDTDSTVFVKSPKVPESRANTGIALGQYVSENTPLVWEDQFLSLGPKFYALKAGKKVTKFKAKGFRRKELRAAELKAVLPDLMPEEDFKNLKCTGDLLNPDAMEDLLYKWALEDAGHIQVDETSVQIRPKEVFSLEFITRAKSATVNSGKRAFYWDPQTQWIKSLPLGWEQFGDPSFFDEVQWLGEARRPDNLSLKRKQRPSEDDTENVMEMETD